MKKFLIMTILAFGIAAQSGAVPNQITYQGTLKEKGVPANGTKNMKFEILNGNQSIWTYQKAVAVTNGLFSVLLNPTGVDWEHITPSLQITIENQLLTPPEPITANAYSMVASAVIDKAISPSKVADGYGLVPAGAILMFTSACPSGWTRFTALDNLFPLGSATYGGTGGSATASHTHTATTSNHKHLLPIWSSAAESQNFVQQTGSNVDGFLGGQSVPVANALSLGGGLGTVTGVNQSYSKAAGGESVTTSATTIATVPPYLSMIFCQKN